VDLPAPFRAQGEHIAIERNGARALFTTRRGGVSQGPYASLNLGRWTDDDPAAVEANRARAAKLADLPVHAFAQGRQVHEATVARVTIPPFAGTPLADADGQATALPGVAPIVLTADCLPVALLGRSAVAMVHAGWRGLAGGVVEAAVGAVRELGEDDRIAAAIGPAVGVCCYEVGDEVRAAFEGEGKGLREQNRINLKAIARRRLVKAGISEVHDVGLCTMCSPPELFFSHRRDNGTTGRQAGIAWLAS
jgi:YfiH family protein